jgi:hypothetical protein
MHKPELLRGAAGEQVKGEHHAPWLNRLVPEAGESLPFVSGEPLFGPPRFRE